MLANIVHRYGKFCCDGVHGRRAGFLAIRHQSGEPWIPPEARGEDAKATHTSESNSDRLMRWNPLKASVGSDWMSWLSQNIDYEHIIGDYVKAKAKKGQLDFQRYSVERMRLLGKNLACARFVVAMGGKVKLFNGDKWYDRETQKTHSLPKERTPGLKVEAIDLSDTHLIHEGMENLNQATSLLYLSLARCSHLSEWSMSNLVNLSSLISLDLDGNDYITERCLMPLQHLPNLKKLNLSNIAYFKNQPMALVMVEELLPDCVITGVELSPT